MGFDFPEDPARRELEKMMEQTRKALGPMTLSDFDRLNKDKPWEQHGLSKRDWDSARGVISVQEEIDRLTGKNFGREMEDRLSATSIARKMAGQLSGDGVAMKLADGLRARQESTPPPILEFSQPAWVQQERERRQRDNEQLDLMRRGTEALERSLADERERTREAQVDKLAAQKRELVARKEAYRWKLITALGVIAGLAITAITAA